VKWRITAAVVGLLIYVPLWILALNGASGLIPLLVIPVVLVIMIAAGNGLNSYLGIDRGRRNPPSQGQ
jgi:4-hydroxybenzoate polyprenyltransferase